jgi:hypothetical protein
MSDSNNNGIFIAAIAVFVGAIVFVQPLELGGIFGGSNAAVEQPNTNELEVATEPADNRDPVFAAVEDTIRANCTNLPAGATVEGPTTLQEFLDPPRNNIFYVEVDGGSSLFFWAYYLNGSASSLKTAYAGEEALAAKYGCPTDINPR